MRPSTDHPVDEPGRGPLTRYVIAATLARTSDGGAVVAIVLMVNTIGGSGWLAGALGACITAPHLLGPFVARSLDTARDSRTVIAAASLAHGTTLAAAVLLYPHTHPAITAALALAAGCCIAGAVIRFLPYAPTPGKAADVPRPLRTLTGILASGPLRRTLYLTVTVAFSVATLPVTAVSSTHTLGVSAAAAGILTAAYGLGNLAGSAGVMIRPSRAEADRLTTHLAAAVAAVLLLITFTPSFPLAVTAYAAVGIANAYFFAATLAARNEYAPDNARGQIFVWVGALKITAGSAGTAAARALISTSAALPLLLAVALTIASTLLSLTERRHNRSRHNAPCGPSPHTEPENGRPHPTEPTVRIHGCSNRG
ncbi:MFS transporter [Streptomyces asoensis]|uniref:MFS transporter n=1 Tax=Streptomyces asoensis TaxID=249586 RepID=UPI0033D96F19